jgi:hypothetical protein|tara:strand:+ start:1398 stop:2201 length:804 start_codon:yes stop_codon:yes gene_type:complete
MKRFYYLCGLPRSGNTLLATILNQNKNIAVTPNSILTEIYKHLYFLKTNNMTYLNFPDEKSFNNLLKETHKVYYKDWQQDIIIDRGMWGVPNNLKFVKNYVNPKPKIIILVRDVLEVLASFIDWSNKNKNSYINNNGKTVDEKCDYLMSNNNQIVSQLIGIKHIVDHENKNNYLLIHYNDLINKTLKTIDRIYEFLDIKKYNHKFKNLLQYSVNGMQYKDYILGDNLHNIKTNKIFKTKRNIKKLLSKYVIEKYGSSKLNVWIKDEK